MLLKWIVCTTPKEMQTAFSVAQEQWAALKGLQGFLGQVGGWDTRNPLQAGILSCWQDEIAYQHFMRHVHDDIYQRSYQQQTYLSISVTLFNDILAIPGSATDFLSALSQGSILRVTDSQVFPEQGQAFEQNQRMIWNPGMAEAGGMLGGACAQAIGDPLRYLVASLWGDEQSHQAYLQTAFPVLRERAQLPRSIQHIKGWVIQLEKSWQVI
jgi:quinol monooxygenase YgiN